MKDEGLTLSLSVLTPLAVKLNLFVKFTRTKSAFLFFCLLCFAVSFVAGIVAMLVEKIVLK